MSEKCAQEKINVGGQAVIEGVMIRSPERIATAVRAQDGKIVVRARPYKALPKRKKWLDVPILRGAISFFEMLILGIASLNFSADIAATEATTEGGETKTPDPKEYKGMSTTAILLTTVIGLGAGIFLFFFLPLWFAKLLGLQKGALGFNLVAGAIRVAMFISYVWALSLFRDFKRLFEYHGAEHKSIFAYENGEELTLENVNKYVTFHPRCGTSFLLIVAVLAILVYSVSDTLYQMITGAPPPLLNRFAVHFSLLPIVAGTSYELLKLSAKYSGKWWWRPMTAPGLWLQRITTREPDPEQLEVARVAVWSSLGMPLPETVLVDES
jgi:uncharacterized protein YqhQ